MKTIDVLLEDRGLMIDELALRAGLPLERVEAIADGRWTPSPREREKLAAALDVPIAEVSWGQIGGRVGLLFRKSIVQVNEMTRWLHLEMPEMETLGRRGRGNGTGR